MTYAQKLKDPRWQKKRLEIFKRDRWTCQWCLSKVETLNVHHHKYTVDSPWDEDPKNLVTVCAECHEIFHKVSDLEAALWILHGLILKGKKDAQRKLGVIKKHIKEELARR
jgi:5-methylcytosine-specific restriction endonuclease McrA